MKLTPVDYPKRVDLACQAVGDGALLVLSQPEAVRNSDVSHVYRQESFMTYLTGFNEAESALLILGNKAKGERVFAFVRERDPMKELWEGKIMGVEGATKNLAVDGAFAITDLWTKLPELLKGTDRLYYRFGSNAHEDQNLIQCLLNEKKKRGRMTKNSLIPVFDSYVISGQLRLRKQPAEIERMRQAALISHKAFEKVFAAVRPGMNEREVHGMLLSGFMAGGSEMEAYGSIVAGGVNACCLHYRDNSCKLNDGELLLIDAGSQFEYYASDVTRTFPIGKTFSPEQKALYEIVLDAQLKCIDSVKIGSNLVDIHDVALRVLSEGLIDVGLLKGSVDEIIETQGYKDFYPHGTSHWLGMDVHDVGDYSLDGKPMPLAENMCFTVEPGLYVSADNQKVPKAFRGIGIRIEDDIVVTSRGADVLTKEIPKSVKEMENRY